jgi:hypothetical protein
MLRFFLTKKYLLLLEIRWKKRLQPNFSIPRDLGNRNILPVIRLCTSISISLISRQDDVSAVRGLLKRMKRGGTRRPYLADAEGELVAAGSKVRKSEFKCQYAQVIFSTCNSWIFLNSVLSSQLDSMAIILLG